MSLSESNRDFQIIEKGILNFGQIFVFKLLGWKCQVNIQKIYPCTALIGGKTVTEDILDNLK